MSEDNLFTKLVWNEKWRGGKKQIQYKHLIIFDLLKPEDKDKRICDIGCGNCILFDILKKEGFPVANMLGVDYSESSIKICREKGYSVVQRNFWDLNIKCDLVILVDVLEHLYPPNLVMKKIKEISKEAIIVVPNFNFILQRIEVLLGKVPFQNKVNRGGHIVWFNHKFLRNLVTSSGFEIIKEVHCYPKMYSKRWKVITKFFEKFPNIFALEFGVRIKAKGD